MARTIVSGGTVVTASGMYRADVLIEGTRIVGMTTKADPAPEDRLIDATGCYVMPGVVDVHTHIQLDTGIYQTGDDWEIGTRTAAWGGVTTVIDFATQYPGQTLVEAIDHRLTETMPAVIDYSLHCSVTHLPIGEEDQLKQLRDRGIFSFKLFTTYRPNYYADDALALRVMRKVADIGGLIMVHCENDSIVSEATESLVAQGKTSLAYHGQARPVIAEHEAVHRILFLAEQAGCTIYIVHCSSARSVHQVVAAQRRGVDAHCETCPQYLLLDDSVYSGATPERYILQPPLRPKHENGMLWNLVREGKIDVISTDHCDYTITQKRETGVFTHTAGGLPGLETLLPLVYTQGNVGRVPLTSLVRMLSTTPAKLFGLADRKGDIRPGLDADIVIYDPAPRSTVTVAALHNIAGYSPYEGRMVEGEVRTVLCRGQLVIENRQFVGQHGYGQFLPCGPTE